MSTRQSNTRRDFDHEFPAMISVGWLLVRFFVLYYPLYVKPDTGLFGKPIHRFWEAAYACPLTGNELIAKFGTLFILASSLLLPGGAGTRFVSWKWPAGGLATGLLLYLGSSLLVPRGDNSTAGSYAVVTTIGYLLAIYGIGGISAGIRYKQHRNRFRRDTGFQQEERLLATDHSLNLSAIYQHNGRNRKSWINIINPRRGVLILGSPGSGKSWFLIEPMIGQLIRMDRALFVYDFKYPALTQFTYGQWAMDQRSGSGRTRFYCINFSDLSHSHRCNLIDPATLQNKNDAMAISETILLSINRIWAARRGEFFVESPMNYLAALVWFLRNYKEGAYCSLPHVIELSKASYGEVFTILNAEIETRGLIGPFKEAFMNKTMEMLDGQVASARIPLSRLDSPDFYYVLSGNDLDLDINNPGSPAVLCLGGDPQRQEALAPVLSLFIDRLNKRINKPDRYPSAIVLDEFATVRATSTLTTIATGRSNDIIPILATQDLTQLTRQYSHDEAYQMMNTCGNLICGQVNGETAKWVSHRFHANAFLKSTVSVNSNDTSVSQTEHTEDAVTQATLAQLSSGEFIGVVADDPDTRLAIKGFHASVKKDPGSKTLQPSLPLVAAVTAEIIRENFDRIVAETEEIVQSEMKRILGDPALKKYVVK
jgi:hypothetical protein